MSSVQIKDKTENIAPAGDEWLFAQDPADPFTVKKMSVETMVDYIADYVGFSPEVVGASIKTFSKLIPISPTFPWFCLSYPSVNFTTANYPTEFIDELRSRKYIYNEFSDPLLSPRAESFTGAWASNVFTLANTPANVAMITELAEDWLYHGSPTSNWRILSDGVNEFNITGINVTSRTIIVNLDSETATGTSVELYTNRVYRDATKARHFSEAGLATYQAGGGKSGRLFRRDQMQRITGTLGTWLNIEGLTATGVFTVSPLGSRHKGVEPTGSLISFNSSGSPNARTSAETDGETIAKSSSRYEYIYVGSYTA